MYKRQAMYMPLSDLLSQIGSEFSILAEELEQLQDSISDLLLAATADHAVLEQAQSLDRVQQHAAQLAKVMLRAAVQIPSDQEVKMNAVLDGVSLSALARRLSGLNCERAVSGEIELL